MNAINDRSKILLTSTVIMMATILLESDEFFDTLTHLSTAD